MGSRLTQFFLSLFKAEPFQNFLVAIKAPSPMEMQIKGEQESWGQDEVPIPGRALCCPLQADVCWHHCSCSIIPNKCSFSCQFWGGSLGTALSKCSVTLAWSVELGRSVLLSFWSYHEVPGAAGAKGIKSSTDKFLMPLQLRIPVNFGDLCLYSCFIPKTFPEDVILNTVFSVNYVKFRKLSIWFFFFCSFCKSVVVEIGSLIWLLKIT